MNPTLSQHPVDRRRFLGALGATSAVGLVLAACGSDDDTGATPTDDTGAMPTDDTGAMPTDEPAAEASAEGWAVGGTDLITVDYPDSAIFAAAATCTIGLTESTTLGPCYFADDTGEDISDGLTGLPMQLCLQVVDDDCTPLEGQRVEVWHCDTAGVYSGDTSESADASSFAGDFCTGGDDAAAQSTWYRGQLTSDADGRVNFKTCFPGWYGGRTLHIHFAVSDDSGTRVISQFCFPDELATEVFTTHESYSSRGDQDTPLADGTDTVFPSSGFESYLLSTERNADGSLLAYHTIRVV